MNRSVNQYRPKGDPNAAVYAPQRDLANLYFPMMTEVFKGLDKHNWNPFFQSLFDHAGITEDQLCNAVVVMIDAHRLFIRDRSVTCVEDAFTKAGVERLPDAVRYALFCRIGEVLCGGFFVALRDVTMQGQDSYCQADMNAMIAAGRALSERLSGKLASYATDAIELSRAEIDELRRLVQQLQDMNDQLTHEINGLSQAVAVCRVRSSGFTRIWQCVKIAWQLYQGQL